MKRIKNLSSLTCFIILSLLLTGIFYQSATPVEAVTVKPGVHSHEQKDGTVVYYQVHGDEFLTFMTDSNGDLVDFAQDGDIYLARWTDNNARDYQSFTEPTTTKIVGAVKGSLVPSVESMRSLKFTIPQYHLQRAQDMRDERDRTWREQFKISSNIMQPTRGVTEQKVLMIYVSFANNGGIPSMNLTQPTSSTLYNKMFNENTYGTVAHYYKTVTNGAVSIKPANTINTANQGIIFVKLPGPHGNWGNAGINDPRNNLVIPALRQAANSSNPGGYVNYAAFDKDQNGSITMDELSIGLIVHGYETGTLDKGKIDPNYPSIHGHSWALDSWLNIGGVNLIRYFAQGAYHYTDNPQLLTIGIIAHELGHDGFGFMDLYDGSPYIDGVGAWSLMGSGSWGGRWNGSKYDDDGTSPTAIDAFHLNGGNIGLQLVAPRSVFSGTNVLTGLTQYVKLETSDPNQYFLVQPRGYVGYDRGLLNGQSWYNSNSSGLLFLLVDKNVPDNELKSPYNHYRVVVVPAGWTSNAFYFTNGSPGDLFSVNKPYILNTSFPSSKIYASTSSSFPTVSSGWQISSIASYVTNAGQNTGTVGGSFLTIPPSPPTINTSSLPAGNMHEYYSKTLNASSITPITWSISSGSLPPGLSLDTTSGMIFGTPTASGTFNFIVSASNDVGSSTKALSIIISPSTQTYPEILTDEYLPDAFIGSWTEPYEVQLAARGATPMTWSITSGYLPDGMYMNSSGLVYDSNELWEVGTFYFTVTVTNSAGSDSKEFALNVFDMPPSATPKKNK